MDFILKKQAGIDVDAFSKTLDRTTTSYKFLWFYSLLEILKQREYSTEEPITYREMFSSMLQLAQDPCQRFSLSLGAGDKICEHIHNMQNPEQSGYNTKLLLKDNDAFRPEDRYFEEVVCKKLPNYVPICWLSPFIKEKTDAKIVQKAKIKFQKGKNPPPYYIRSAHSGREIIVHRRWAVYFAEHERVMRDWCLWNFARYLEKRNPNIPNILSKISISMGGHHKRNLIKQRQYWKEVIKWGGELRCIYSDQVLSLDTKFALDHHIPWTFVGHDNLWNLIPADERVNSSKGDRLPSNRRYLDKLAESHLHALTVRNQYFPEKWKRLIESYSTDLKLATGDLTDRKKVHQAYQTFVPPLTSLAKANGFRDGWTHQSKTPLLD